MTNGKKKGKRKLSFINIVLRFFWIMKTSGLSNTFFRGLRLFWVRTVHTIRKIIFRKNYKDQLAELERRISDHSGFIDLIHIPIGWNTPSFQRYQQISLQFSQMEGLALYGGHPTIDSDIFVFREIRKNLFVFNAKDAETTKHIFAVLQKQNKIKILRIESIDYSTTIKEIYHFFNNGFEIIYEYIDEISEELNGYVPDFVLKRHNELLKDERFLVITTSDYLFKSTQQYRTKNIILNTNGVDPNHWKIDKKEPPIDIRPAITGNIIIGYHGALARWIDYELLRMIADHKDYELVLIGYEHDQEFAKSGLKKHPKVHYLGNKSYFDLNLYAAYYDIAVLPFKITNFTNAVSPIKIFEYMAALKPIVATNLSECTKYKSCLVADDKNDFIQKLEFAKKLKEDTYYLKILETEAEENSWGNKATEILRLLSHQTSN